MLACCFRFIGGGDNPPFSVRSRLSLALVLILIAAGLESLRKSSFGRERGDGTFLITDLAQF